MHITTLAHLPRLLTWNFFVLYVPGTLQKHVASRHLKGSRKLELNFDFTGGFISGFGTTTGTTTGLGSTDVAAADGVGTSTGSGNFNITSGSSGFLSLPFGTATGSSASGGAGSQVGNSAVTDDIGTSQFDGTTTVTSKGSFGSGFSPFVAGEGFGPTGGFGLGTGTFDIVGQSEGTSGGGGAGTSSGSSLGTASNFGGGTATGGIPMLFSAGGLGSGASDGTAIGAGDSGMDPTGASFSGTGMLTGINFSNFGGAIVGPGGTVTFPFVPPP
jgi:hypothetical protein